MCPVDVWEWTPLVAVMLHAGLVSLPQEPMEAADVDGAARWQAFRYVTLPLIKPVALGVGRYACTPSRYLDGRVEHDPETCWSGVCLAARDALAAAAAGMAKPGDADLGGKAGPEVAATGPTGMAPSTVLVGADGLVFLPYTIWAPASAARSGMIRLAARSLGSHRRICPSTWSGRSCRAWPSLCDRTSTPSRN